MLRAYGVVGVMVCLGFVGIGRAPGWVQHTDVPARWSEFLHLPAVVDLTPPRRDGSITVAAAGRLSLLRIGGAPMPFARGPHGYSTPMGPEPYLALAGDNAVPGAGCSFHPDDVYAIEPHTHPGVIVIDAQGRARRVTSVTSGPSLNGIAFDTVGHFGHRLLVVTTSQHGHTTLLAVDCTGRANTITRRAPRVEGGIAVAPNSFGAFGGDLVAPDEHSGRIVAIDARGTARIVARSGLPRGGDIGVESVAFVPPDFGRSMSAYLADRGVPGNPHPGTDSILRLAGTRLVAAGVRPGDLLVATEGGAETIAIRCARTCSVRHIADGPSVTHGEGHIVFAPDS